MTARLGKGTGAGSRPDSRSVQRGTHGQNTDRERAAGPYLPLGKVRRSGSDPRPQLGSLRIGGHARVNVVLTLADPNVPATGRLEVQKPLWGSPRAAHPRSDDQVAILVVQ